MPTAIPAFRPTAFGMVAYGLFVCARLVCKPLGHVNNNGHITATYGQ